MPLPVVMQSLLRHQQLLLQLINFSMVGSLCSLPCSLGILKVLLCALQQLLAVVQLPCSSLQGLLQSLDIGLGVFKLLCLLVQLLALLLQLPFSLQQGNRECGPTGQGKFCQEAGSLWHPRHCLPQACCWLCPMQGASDWCVQGLMWLN